MKLFVTLGVMLLAVNAVHGDVSISPWVPIFKGIDQAGATNDAAVAGRYSAKALRVDLQDPDIRLLVTPAVTNNYTPDVRETLLQTPGEFLVEHGVQVAVNAVHFYPPGYNSPSGSSAWLHGPAISEGKVVSEQINPVLSLSAMFFGTNNQPAYVHLNWPATNTDGIFNGVAGMYPLLSNGVNISYSYTNDILPGDDLHSDQPRTAFGLSEEGRYLIMVAIDGRQPGFSDGAYDWEMADLLLLLGAWNGMNMDGGGSTCMVKAEECTGVPIELNHNYYQAVFNRPGAQRPVGCNFGVFAKPLPSTIKDLVIEPGSTTALLTWTTDLEMTTQVEYGLTKNLGSATPLDARLARKHVATVTGLTAGSNYYFQAVSTVGLDRYASGCRFATTNAIRRTLIFDLTNSWTYTTNTLDGVNWKAPAYNDSEWLGSGPGLLHVESNPAVAPRNTLLPPGIVPVGTLIPRTYYFRTHFPFNGTTNGVSLTFSNYVDDGAVFYLNGGEVFRLRMQPFPTVITNQSQGGSGVCAGTAQGGDAATICPDVFTIAGNLLTNLVQGNNVLAVEVHNQGNGPDIVFGSALIESRPSIATPTLNLFLTEDVGTLFWNGTGFTVQQTENLSSNQWMDVPGPITSSPAIVTNQGTLFYRLRQ
jgi:hypothetical protein